MAAKDSVISRSISMQESYRVKIGRGSKRLRIWNGVSNSVRRAILEPLTVLTHLLFSEAYWNVSPGLRIVLAEYDLCWLHPFS